MSKYKVGDKVKVIGVLVNGANLEKDEAKVSQFNKGYIGNTYIIKSVSDNDYPYVLEEVTPCFAWHNRELQRVVLKNKVGGELL